jgi:FG-GAP-like repeat
MVIRCEFAWNPDFMRAQDHTRFLRRAGLLAFAAFCWFVALAGQGTAARPASAQAFAHFAIADFDGDSRPDLATVNVGQGDARNTRYWIAFHLSGRSSQTVGITAPDGGLQITSRDVNGDSFPDVIVTTAWTNKPVAILLNDGLGNFTSSNPSQFQSAFTTSGTSWTLAENEIRDATALLLERYVPGDCRTECGLLPPGEMLRRLAPTSSFGPGLRSIAPFVGRAPPSSVSV